MLLKNSMLPSIDARPVMVCRDCYGLVSRAVGRCETRLMLGEAESRLSG